MPSESEADDSLLRAIAELRADVNHLIDDQVAYVKDRLMDELAAPRTHRTAPAPVPVVNVPEPPEEAAKARNLDPRQRLDALAKHLDHRLRQTNGPGNERTERSPGSEG